MNRTAGAIMSSRLAPPPPMKRKNVLLIAAALLGATATALLIVLMLGDGSPASDRSGPAGGWRGGGTDANGSGPAVPFQTVGAEERVRDGRSGIVGSPGVVGGRQPFDSPETLRERTLQSSRVREIIQEILTAPDQNRDERMKLHQELRQLIRQLGGYLDRSVRDDLLRMLTEVDEKWRPLIGDTLGYLQGDVETATRLMKLLKEDPKSVYTRNAILTALGKMQVKEVLPDLIQLVGSGADGEPLIARAIGSIGGPEASLALLGMLGKPLRHDTQLEIERLLGQAQNPLVMERIREGLGDADRSERVSMLRILGMTGDAKHAPAVHALLADETDPIVRKAAIEALGRFGDPESGEILLQILQSGAKEDVAAATKAMYRIKDPETVMKLAGEWDRLGDDSRVALIGAASRLPDPGERMTEIATDSLRSPLERIRTSAARALGKRGQDQHVDLLRDYLLRADTARERSTALQALRSIDTKKAAEAGLASLHVLPERQRASWRAQFEKVLARDRERER